MRVRFTLRPLFAAIALAAFASFANAQSAVPAAPRFGGYFQARELYQDKAGLSASLNRACISADGALPNRFSYRFLAEFEASGTARTAASVSLREAIVLWKLAPYGLSFGQMKAPFSREYLVPVSAYDLADLPAVVDTLAPKYDTGAMGEITEPYGSLAFGVFNGEGQNFVVNRDSSVLFVARGTVRPVSQVSLGGSWARYSPDSSRYGGDAVIEQSGVMLRGEVLGQRKRGRARDDFGWSLMAAARLTPTLQLLARQEDFQRPGISMARRISATTVGANLELPGGRTRILCNFVSRRTGYPRIKKNSLIAQVQVKF